MTKKSNSSQTKTVQAGLGYDPAYNAVVPPLYMSSTYLWSGPEEKGPYDYGRTVNPNRDILASALAELEGGAGAVVTSTGMSAIDLVFNLFTADQLIIAPHDCYGGTYRLLESRARQGRLRVEFIDQNDDASLKAALAKSPALVLIETPSNPLMRLVDIKAICKAAHAAGAKVMADNTFLSPARQRPLDLGCDFVIHSTTKYLNGHSDVVGGVTVAKTGEDAEQLAWWANNVGITGAPFDSYQTLRGLRTLHVRMDAQETNAQALAEWLSKHDKVSAVNFPGLPSHPQYDLAQRQQSGPGAMLSFEIDGNPADVDAFLRALNVFQLAASLGGTESLICYPRTMTHRGMSDEAQTKAGIGKTLIRVSVGLEHIDDLIADIEQGFAQI